MPDARVCGLRRCFSLLFDRPALSLDSVLGPVDFMSTQSFSIVRRAQSQAEAGLMISLLQEAGLHPVELSTAFHVSMAGPEFDYAVKVPVEEAERAAEILNAYGSSEGAQQNPQ